MKKKFYENLINGIEKNIAVTQKEKDDKAEAIVAIAQIIGRRGFEVRWKKDMWTVVAS